MSLLWVEGFEGYGTSTGVAPQPTGILGRKYSVFYESSMDLEAGRIGGYSLELPGTQWLQTLAINTNTTIIVGFAVKFNALDSGGYSFLKLCDGEDVNITLETIITGELVLSRGSTVLGTTSGLGLMGGNWYWIELKVVIDNSIGSYVLRVGESTVLSDSGADTQAGTHSYCDCVKFTGNPIQSIFFDDVYICNGAGSVNNDFLGNVRVSAIFPSEAGNSTQWTPSAGDNYGCVDENPANDDTDYVETDTVGYKDLYGYDSLSAITGIKGIQINTQCRETDASSFSLITPIRSGGTDYDDSAQAIGTTDYIAKRRIAELDPDTSAAWIYAGINNAEFGIKVG